MCISPSEILFTFIVNVFLSVTERKKVFVSEMLL